MQEIWKDIVGFEGLYQISDKGNVRSLDRIIKLYNGGQYKRKGKTLQPLLSKDKYYQIHLLKNGVAKTIKIHRLVATAFIPNPNHFAEVNHKNEIKTDNRVENLEWCTQEYNKRYGTARQRMRLKMSKKVNQYDLNGNFIKTWCGTREIERNLGIFNQSISLCCLGKRNKAGGFKWRYCEDT